MNKFEEWFQKTLTERAVEGPQWLPPHMQESLKELFRAAYDAGFKDASS